MPWSMPIAEPVGVIVGVVCGRLAANHGRKLARGWGWPEVVGGMLGAAVGHYLASAVTKLVVNTVMADPAGAAANVSVTSPTASLGHALFEGFSQFLPDLDHDTIWQTIHEAFDTPEVSEALQDYGDSFASPQLDSSHLHPSPLEGLPQIDTYRPYSDPAFLQSIADSQGSLPICGLETIENMVQIHYPGISNSLSDQCIASGWLDANGHLPMERYQPLLQSVGISSQWISANDFQTMLSIASQSGGTIGLYGDAFYLDSTYQVDALDHAANPDKYFHAITLEEPWVNGRGETVGFIGVDSNHPGRSMFYTFAQLQKFVQGSPQKLGQFAMQALAILPT